jgi:hypothetical protein
MRGNDHFPALLLRVTAPLLVWGAHFFFCYIAIAAGCLGMLRVASIAGLPALKVLMLLATLLALAAVLLMTLRPWRRVRGPQGRSLRDLATMGGGVLAALGIGWTLIPLALLDVCHR